MRQILLLVALFATLAAEAQNMPNVAIGVVKSGADMEFVSTPKSTIVVDMTLSKSQFTAGEYARYAQRYLGVRALLSDKVTSTIAEANIALAQSDIVVNSSAKESTSTIIPTLPLSAERTSAETLSPEQRAEKCANKIFANRKLIQELISGDVGEGVFGAGLTTALQHLKSQELECTALFMGSTQETTTNHRFTIPINAESTRYMLCRFDTANGEITSVDNIDGEAVYLQITPAPAKDSTYNIAVGKEPIKRLYVEPNYARCDLYVGADIVKTAQIPLYEFGATTTVIYDPK